MQNKNSDQIVEGRDLQIGGLSKVETFSRLIVAPWLGIWAWMGFVWRWLPFWEGLLFRFFWT
jgi:hypothetical protein